MKTPIISCNGALIRDSLTNEILYQQPLPQALALAVLTKAIAANVDHIVYTANMVYGHPESGRIAFMLKYNAQLDNDNYRIPIDTETEASCKWSATNQLRKELIFYWKETLFYFAVLIN
nr:HAD hydrolase family protein [Spiroplasma endosymbiont of Megaselia nigra]